MRVSKKRSMFARDFQSTKLGTILSNEKAVHPPCSKRHCDQEQGEILHWIQTFLKQNSMIQKCKADDECSLDSLGSLAMDQQQQKYGLYRLAHSPTIITFLPDATCGEREYADQLPDSSLVTETTCTMRK